MPTKVDYLTAKRSVDDRALNRRIWKGFVSALELESEKRPESEPIRIVEVGAGIGTMVARLAEWERLSSPVAYRAVDLDPACIAAGRDRLPGWLEAAGYDVGRRGGDIVAWPSDGDRRRPPRFEISLEVADATTIRDDADAVVAAAVLDVVELEATLAHLRELLRTNGLLYAPWTFDGTTTFLPRDQFDDRIERLYHRHMDDVRDQPGSSRAGREVLETAPDLGYDLLEVGGSDWVIAPRDGSYRDEAAVVLEHLLETIGDALADYPDAVLEPAVRDRWLAQRRRHLEQGEFGAIAHHLDVLARV